MPATGLTNITSVGQVSVTSSSGQIVPQNNQRAAVVLTNTSASVTVYITGGGAGAVASASTGHALLPNASVTLPITGAVYGITASGTATVTFLEVS